MADDSSELRRAASKFLNAFEVVFDRDWVHTQRQLGLKSNADEDAATALLLAMFGEEPLPALDPNRTFVNHTMDSDALEMQNWGNYETLLAAYSGLKSVLDDFGQADQGEAVGH